MAFGAGTRDVYRLIVGEGMTPVAGGLVLGLAGAAALTRLVAQELFGITSSDLPTHAVSVAVVLLAAVAALLVPARRATRVDPVVVLRDS